MEEKILKLHAAPAAVTDATAAVLWDRPEWADQVKTYMVEKNGKTEALCQCTDCTLDALEADTSYRITVRAMLLDGTVTTPSNTVVVRTKPAPKVFDITAYGAVPGGEALNTKAIQAAIDACTPGGMVYVPQGVFRTGALYLKSDMTLYLERGSKLLGSEKLEDYPIFTYRWEGREQSCYSSLINTPPGSQRNHDITIDGLGSIDGSGVPLRQKAEELKVAGRGRTVCLRSVDRLYLKGVTIRNSPAWCTHLIFCQDITVNGITICSKYDELGVQYPHMHNGDGLDLDSCCDAAVIHCTISSQDDCIAVKSGIDQEGREVGKPSSRVRISNCRLISGFGVVCGSDMSGGVSDVLVQDCEFVDVYGIGQVKSRRGRGGVVERVLFDHCTHYNRNRRIRDGMWFRGTLYVDCFYGHKEFDVNAPAPLENAPKFRDITFQNIVLDTIAGNAVYLSGLPECPAENITLRNVVALGNNDMVVHHVENLTLENCVLMARDK